VTQRTQTPTRRRKSAVATSSSTANPGAAARGPAPEDRADLHTGIPDAAARREMIAIAAYFRAERRGFAAGDPLDDWLSAEAEITQMFAR
jgi:hypothetical protein